MYNRDSEIDMANVEAFLKDAYDKVMTQEDPEVLTAIRNTFKKTVPFSKRMYVAAFLTKELQKGFHGNFRGRRDFRERDNKSRFNSDRPSRDRRAAGDNAAVHSEEKERTPRPRVEIDPSMAAVIFISIGKNRRVYPRDLVGLLISVAGIERDRIGDIRVLANYSFVQLFKEDAEKAINAINGYDYRGRKLAVSYSRQKDGDSADVSADGLTADQSAEDAAAYAAAEKAASNDPFSAPHISSEAPVAEDAGNESEGNE